MNRWTAKNRKDHIIGIQLDGSAHHDLIRRNRRGSWARSCGSFDVTPNRYIVMCCVERAKELLSVRGLSVSDVAEHCGFSDVYYFSKVFKQICGVPPSKWK